MADDSDEEAIDLFQEPEGYYQPEKEATFVKHRMLNGEELELRLVGNSPLWVRKSRCSPLIYLSSHRNMLKVPF